MSDREATYSAEDMEDAYRLGYDTGLQAGRADPRDSALPDGAGIVTAVFVGVFFWTAVIAVTVYFAL